MADAPPRSPLRRVLRAILTIPLALWVFLEEWVWVEMLAFMAWLGRLPPIHWAEAQIAKLPRYAALIAFVIPGAILLPFKLVAFWLIAHGHGLYGLTVFVIAKIVGTAFLARIFSLTKPALLSIGWFSKCYYAIIGWKERLYAYVRALPAYQRVRELARAMKLAIKARWKAMFGGAW
ncbi:MAG: hypothetical protein ABL931_13950 [Usitatibacteraceae bacterium]